MRFEFVGSLGFYYSNAKSRLGKAPLRPPPGCRKHNQLQFTPLPGFSTGMGLPATGTARQVSGHHVCWHISTMNWVKN